MDTKSTNWGEAEWSTLSPLTSVELAEELPTMAAATIAGVVVVVLLAIGLVFTLGIMLDCRHQKIVEKKIKRRKLGRRADIDVEGDGVSIADRMEPTALSPAPAPAPAHYICNGL